MDLTGFPQAMDGWSSYNLLEVSLFWKRSAFLTLHGCLVIIQLLDAGGDYVKGAC